MVEQIEFGCSELYPDDIPLTVMPDDLADLTKVVTMMLHGSLRFRDVVKSNLSVFRYEHASTEEELILKRQLVAIYKEEHKQQGGYFTEEIEAEFERMACEYQSRRFGIRDFETEKVWAEVGRVLTRKYFQSKANYRVATGKFMLHEMRWYLKQYTKKFCQRLASTLQESSLVSGQSTRLIISPYDPLSMGNSIYLKIDENFESERVLASIPKVTSQTLITACKSAIANPPYESDTMWGELDEYFSFLTTPIGV